MGHEKEDKHHQEQTHTKYGHNAKVVALGAGAFAIHEHHQVKADPKHAGRHPLKETIAGATAVDLAVHEYHKHNKKH